MTIRALPPQSRRARIAKATRAATSSKRVEARADAVARGEGGDEPETFTAAGDYSGNAGTGGEVKNQDADAQ